MKKIFSLGVLLFVLPMLIFSASSAMASTPSLSVSSTGSGDDVQINVTGDANAGVLFFYTKTGTGSQMDVLGTTNSSGSYSVVISSSAYGIAQNSLVYVKTGGINGQQSQQVTWPYYTENTNTNNNLSLSQTALLLNAGQTSSITANVSYLYLLSNSSPAVANINFNASQITVQALSYGSTVAKICAVGSTTNCSDLNITVQSTGAQQLTFSQNNFSIYSGQSSTVTISGGSGSYLITNNSNVNSIHTSLSGSTITLTATGTSGSTSITVCTSNMSYCGILNVNATSVSSTAVTFSQTSPFVVINQSTTVTIYGGTGTSFYVSSNSNPSIVQPNISNNTLTLLGIASGNSNISVCAYAGSCATVAVTVGNSGSNNGPLNLSQSSVNILAGQSTAITISGGSTPYTISAPTTLNIFSSNISGNILTIYGVNAGSTSASVCSSVGCSNLDVTVGTTTSTSNPPTFSQNNLLLSVGQQSTVYVSGNGGYYISNNSSPNVASIMINGNSANVTANTAGTTNISICQNSGQCAVLYITVSSPTTNTPVVTPVVYFSLLRYLGPGDDGDDVLDLQKALAKLGLLSATPNGHYGPATTAAVQAFQAQNGISQTGNVGPLTKTALENKKIVMEGTSSGWSNTSNTASQTSQLEALIASLQAQINAIISGN
jgi:hypothetical protein